MKQFPILPMLNNSEQIIIDSLKKDREFYVYICDPSVQNQSHVAETIN